MTEMQHLYIMHEMMLERERTERESGYNDDNNNDVMDTNIVLHNN